MAASETLRLHPIRIDEITDRLIEADVTRVIDVTSGMEGLISRGSSRLRWPSYADRAYQMQGRHIRPPGVRSAWKIAVMTPQRSANDAIASGAFVLDSTSIDEIADRLTDAVVARIIDLIRMEGLIARAGGEQRWLDAQGVAEQLGVSREWVYEHADELGARRIGNGPRPRLRFPEQAVKIAGRGARFAPVGRSSHSREAAR
jgi:hypothetical protein